MGAIPASTLPGHKRLHDRAVLGLDTSQEDQDLDFKESATWDAIQHRIIHTLMAMANLRDGGLVIVGVAQKDDQWQLTGIAPEHLATYEPDDILSRANSFASPYLELDVVLVTHNGSQFLALYAYEFRDTPVVCKKNGATGSPLVVGRVYVRPPGMARTTTITDASQMQDLLALAAEKRARQILEVGQRIGLVPSESSTTLFDDELEGL